jgi:hypothetical protein
VIARTTLGRGLAVWLSMALSQLAVPAAAPAAPGIAGGHLVDSSQVAQRLLERAKTRDEKVRLFQEALGAPEVQRQARSMGLDPGRLRAAVPHLTDRELADLSARAANAKDVAAGHGGSDAVVIVGLVLLIAGLVVLAAAGSHGYDYYYDDCGCY